MQTLARAPFAVFGSSISVLIWTIFVLHFHGGPRADPHLDLWGVRSEAAG